MRYVKHSKKHNNNGNWKNNNRHDYEAKNTKPVFRPTIQSVSEEYIRQTEAAIREFKEANQHVCPICNAPVKDMSTAFRDPKTEKPMHFDCALGVLETDNKLGNNEKIIYIGQGRFGIVYFPNIHDSKHFEIKKIIEWEEKDKKPEWRDEMSELYSKVR